MKHECVMCGCQYESPSGVTLYGRGNSKTFITFCKVAREACCSDECANKLLKDILEKSNKTSIL